MIRNIVINEIDPIERERQNIISIRTVVVPHSPRSLSKKSLDLKKVLNEIVPVEFFFVALAVSQWVLGYDGKNSVYCRRERSRYFFYITTF